MTQYLFANNAGSTLAASISSTTTTITLASGGGALFPTSLGSGQAFKITLADAATTLIKEICLVTAVSADTFTIIRGQEGTVSNSYSVGDLVQQLNTAGTMQSLLQLGTTTTSQLLGVANSLATSISVDTTTMALNSGILSSKQVYGMFVYTAGQSGSVTFPSGAQFARYRAWASGGRGGSGGGSAGGGGSGGGYGEGVFTITGSYTYSVGSVIASGTGTDNQQNSSGQTILAGSGVTINCTSGYNGNGGATGVPGAPTAGSGSGSGSYVTINGQVGGAGIVFTTGTDALGGFGGATFGASCSSQPHSTLSSPTNGNAGILPGVGGSGGIGTGATGGASGPGLLILEYWG